MDCERRDPNKRIAFGGDVRRIPLQVERLGFSVEKAHDYCLVGCNEMTAMGGVCFGGHTANALRVIDRLFNGCRAENRRSSVVREVPVLSAIVRCHPRAFA